MKVTYRNRSFIGDYRCIDHEETIEAVKTFRSSGVLYCYLDRFNVKAISLEDVISVE